MKRIWLASAVLAAVFSLPAPAAAVDAEANLAPFLGPPRFEVQQLFDGGRFPNVVVATDGTVIATWGNKTYQVRRSEDGGKTWGPVITVADPGFQGGGTIVDETTGDILVFVEAHHPIAPLTVYRSTDHGKSWKAEEVVIHPDSNGNVPSMHMNEHGITLLHGPHAGRLLRPTRWYAEGNRRDQWPNHYTNAICSDDHGKTWHTSEPVPGERHGRGHIG